MVWDAFVAEGASNLGSLLTGIGTLTLGVTAAAGLWIWKRQQVALSRKEAALRCLVATRKVHFLLNRARGTGSLSNLVSYMKDVHENNIEALENANLHWEAVFAKPASILTIDRVEIMSFEHSIAEASAVFPESDADKLRVYHEIIMIFIHCVHVASTLLSEKDSKLSKEEKDKYLTLASFLYRNGQIGEIETAFRKNCEAIEEICKRHLSFR